VVAVGILNLKAAGNLAAGPVGGWWAGG
jgi:hypothetical protein